MTQPGANAVAAAYREGVAGICHVAGTMTVRDWHRTACGDWSAGELARHLLTMSERHHVCLDRALEQQTGAPFPESELDDQNELGVHEKRDLAGHEAVVMFKHSADAYLGRVMANLDIWDLPYGTPSGPTTVGQHLAAAASEWNLHAWDLGRAIGLDHVSHNASSLQLDSPSPNAMGRLRTRLHAFNPRRDTWQDILTSSGRVAR